MPRRGPAGETSARLDPVRLILGRRLANREQAARRIGPLEGLPTMGLDGLGSSAYGPEAALTILAPLGAASLAYIGWVMAPIVVLLAVLFLSYWQTIAAYPVNGGAYLVAKENLGTDLSLLAAAALMIDYVLNVAVGISAGVGALVSAVPDLQPYILPLCLAVLAVITLANLRGTQESGRLFALPTYLFVASFSGILALGAWRAVAGGGHPAPIVAPPPLAPATAGLGLWLVLRAFAAGCTAMTGVEAVSNGMSAFKEPVVKNGHRTLTLIVGILALLLVGIAYLASAYRVGAMDQTRPGYQSVLSQLAGAVVGRGLVYDLAIGSLLAVLALSANTSFAAFPRLCRAIAVDSFLPRPFAVAGRRLVYSVGIGYLAVSSGLLLIAFRGITDRLIPLFAIGAFLTFTLSQAGMVAHWRRKLAEADGRERRAHRIHFAINTLGATTTAAALAVIVVAKFAEGAWITLLAIPCVIALLKAIRAYYDRVAAEVRDPTPLTLADPRPPIVVVALEDWDRLADQALELALTLSPDVIGVHLTQLSGPEAAAEHRNMRADWRVLVEEPARAAGLTPPRLMILPGEYRTIHRPLLKLVDELGATFQGRRIAVLIPELVKQRWYQHLLHSHRAERLCARLMREGGPRTTVVRVPWRLRET